MHTLILTLVAMLSFAANSILCRVALLGGYIDAGSFSLIRILSGAVTLLVIYFVSRQAERPSNKMTGKSMALLSASLFGYVFLFSFAYIELGTGTGALILFGSVQLTMLAFATFKGEPIHRLGWLGVLTAVSGFIVLLFPSATQPDIRSALFMALSGMCWGIFSIQGRALGSPLKATTTGFCGSAIMVLLISPWLFNTSAIQLTGLFLALCSGVLTSALGYVIWYSALKGLTLLNASVVQLSVPALALLGGALWVNEPLTHHQLLSTGVILGGIALTFLGLKKN